MLYDTLIECGLSEKEAKVYLSLLEVGAAGAGEIAVKAMINRSSVYVALESLKKLGLVIGNTVINPQNEVAIQRFTAASPDILIHAAKDRVRRERDLERRIGAMVPELKGLSRSFVRVPKTYLYDRDQSDGIDIQWLLEEQASRGMQKCRLFGNAAVLSGIKIQTSNSGGKVPVVPLAPQAKIASSEPNRSHDDLTDLVICQDKVGFLTADAFIVLENRKLADILKSLFDLAMRGQLS